MPRACRSAPGAAAAKRPAAPGGPPRTGSASAGRRGTVDVAAAPPSPLVLGMPGWRRRPRRRSSRGKRPEASGARRLRDGAKVPGAPTGSDARGGGPIAGRRGRPRARRGAAAGGTQGERGTRTWGTPSLPASRRLLRAGVATARAQRSRHAEGQNCSRIQRSMSASISVVRSCVPGYWRSARAKPAACSKRRSSATRDQG